VWKFNERGVMWDVTRNKEEQTLGHHPLGCNPRNPGNPLTSKLLDRGHTNHKSRYGWQPLTLQLIINEIRYQKAHGDTPLCTTRTHGGCAPKYTLKPPQNTHSHKQASNTQTMPIHLEFGKSWSWSPGVLESYRPPVCGSRQTNK